MKHGKLLLPTATSLILLMIASAGGSPSMSLPSFANYHLVASSTNVQDCTTANVTIAALVCGNQPSALVTINDDGACTLSNDTRCSFSPATVTISPGMSVTWRNNGILSHTVVSNSTANGSLPTFVVNIYQGNGYSSQQFFKTGTYNYSDLVHSWIKGSVVVTQATVPPPVVASFAANGSIGWNVAGLDQKDALLGINHKINVYDQTAPQQPLVYNDSALFEQSIDLGTREETPSIVGFLQTIPFGLNLYGFNNNGFGYGFGGYGYPGPYGYYPGPFYNFQPVHTLWWVNGSLDNGSVVELLTGYASVTGSKSIALGSGPGTQDAWTVASTYEQNSNQAQPQPSNNFNYCPFGFGYYGGFQPQPQCYVSQSNFAVSLNADYGQHSDLLFGFSSTISSLTQTTTQYPAGSTIYGFNNGYFNNGFPVTSPVSLIRTVSTKLTFTLTLSNTNLDLSKKMTLQPATSSSATGTTTSGGNGASSPSPTSNLPLSMTMIYFLAGAGSAVLAGGALWGISRSRRKSTLSTAPPVPITTP